MFRKRFLLTVVLIIFSLIFLAQAQAAGKKFVRMVSGPSGGSWYPLGSAMMQIVEKNVPGVSTSNGPGGGVGNCKSIQRGQAEMGWSYTHTSVNAYNGKGKFKKKHSKLRHVMSLYPGVFQVVVPKKSNIKTIAGLADKRIVPGKVGFTGTAIAEIVLKAYGITFDSIKKKGGSVSFVGYTDSAALMKDGHSDCYMAVTSCPQSTIIDLNFRPGVRFLPITDADYKKVHDLEPGLMQTVIPKTAYKGLPADIPTVGTVTNIIASADMPDDLVYQAVKALYANWGELAKVKKKAIEASKKENALLGNGIPVHPGAMRYYKEQGIKPK
jgi:TRAP transporter TAXI family solute receptor